MKFLVTKTQLLAVAVIFHTLVFSQTAALEQVMVPEKKIVPKQVFAHYFTPYPISLDNKDASQDYYSTQYLNPFGENSKFLSNGGLLRSRPMPRASIQNVSNWRQLDALHEVSLAADIGIDGFAINILDTSGRNWQQLINIYNAAETHGKFKILIMPDMNAVFKDKPEEFIPTILTLAKRKASYRLDDGRLVIAPYLAENKSPRWWKNTMDELEQHGVSALLWPVYQGWPTKIKKVKEAQNGLFNKLIIGVSDWGARTTHYAQSLKETPLKLHKMGKNWMAPVAPQDVRPKSNIYTESSNSVTYRQMWESAILGNADWVHIITWNDYSESTHIAPSTQIGESFYRLTEYFISWYKKGVPPTLDEDLLFGFYRRHKTSANLSLKTQTRAMKLGAGEKSLDKIELVAILKSPAVLMIEIGGKKFTKNGSKGINSFKVPLFSGKPIFKIVRNDLIITEIEGPTAINTADVLDVLDFSYHGVSKR